LAGDSIKKTHPIYSDGFDIYYFIYIQYHSLTRVVGGANDDDV